ncbi:HD-GYP domain-containing protein [Paenibacillus piri]|uniref:HD-GYP domain-containing protein n=1 Tax=Paenibacillus piri TaxID=2547395 RepID=UPI0014050481|nr:HD-GYP domain-containing protein [Paenibacillus piri]
MHAKIGVSVKKDIFNRVGILLVPAHTRLKQEDIKRLIRHRVDLAEVEFGNEPDGGGETAADSENQLIEDATAQVKELFDRIRFGHYIPIRQISSTLLPVIRQAADSPNLFRLLNGLRSKDNYTYKHNIGVGVLSTLIGKWMNMDEEELTLLAMAATLHDVGKMKVPIEIINKPEKLTEAEYRLMRRHTIHGYELLKSTAGAPHRIALVALQHHEREDGSGYPFGLKGDRLDPFTKIVSIADVFHAMTSKRSYHDASSFFTVMNEMNTDVFGKLNSNIFLLFMKKMMESMVGSYALLTDGRTGKIVLANPFEPISPLIQIDSLFLDLSKDRTVRLQEIVG